MFTVRNMKQLNEKIKEKKLGFTLIELLIVVMLIGILSGVILGVINVGGIRAKARDAQRVSDIKKIQTALELYFADNRTYVVSADWQTVEAALNSPLRTGSTKYLNVLPVDPSRVTAGSPCSAATNYDYWYRGTAGAYILAANMEVLTSDDVSPCTGLNNWTSLTPTCTPVGNCYGVENPF
jgi:prepilin-type N-terminal cleavage/methylation domain-containing protein